MAKIPFTVSARTAKLIGRENFANADGAIVELVKNTYDADARNCIIIFENHGQYSAEPSIYIIDNGIGMTDDTIVKNWMQIGTDDKLQNYQSDKGRVKTGAKGIGRFALDRLGAKAELFTVSKKTNKGYIWNVNWNDFEIIGASIADINADLIEEPNLILEEKLAQNFSFLKKIELLLKEFRFNTGTILKISDLKDKWTDDAIRKLFGNLEVLIPPQEQPEFDIHLFSTSLPDEYGQVNSAYFDDYDYKLEAKYLADEKRTLSISITRNELNIENVENQYKEIFDFAMMQKYPYRLEDIKSKTFSINTSLNDFKGFSTSVDDKLIDEIGEFGFTFYYLKNTISDDKTEGDLKKYPYKPFVSATRKAWLSKFGGVKVFRDDFRVRPYGENGEDWLKLGERQAQSPGGAGQKLGGYRIRPNQIAGTIKISRITNISFQDKSGREGIQENEVFELFKNVLLEIISLFEKDRNVIMFHLSELAKKRFVDEENKRKAKEEKERILREQEELERIRIEKQNRKKTERPVEESKDNKAQLPNDDSIEETPNSGSSTPIEIILAKGNEILEQELEGKEDEIRLLRNLASVGLIISSFAHEVKSLRSRLIPRTTFLLQELKKYITDDELKTVKKDDNPFYMLQLIQDEDVKLKHWLDYSLSSLRRDKRQRTNLNFGEYFERFKSTWEKAIAQRNIKIKLIGTKDSIYTIRAFEVDMDSIFNNLLSNSLSALKQKQSIDKRIEIEWKKNDGFIEIYFRDNGIGLAKEYKTNPEEVFNSFETSKRDRKGNVIGTGLGLYIVDSIIKDYNNSSISITEINNGFALKILFPTRN